VNLLVTDTETSNLPEKGGQLLELAWNNLELQDGKWTSTFAHETYVQYAGPIDPVAHASHHIDPQRLAPESGAITRENAIILLKRHIREDTYLVAHNSPFDAAVLPEIVAKWLDTLKISKRIWPEAPAHSNQVLRYWLGIKPDLTIATTIKQRAPHQALYDVATTTGIILKMLERHTPDELYRICYTPQLLKIMPFGKHKGLAPSEVVTKDPGYFDWLRKQKELEPDVIFTLKHMGYHVIYAP